MSFESSSKKSVGFSVNLKIVPKLSANLIAEHFLINCFSSSSVSTLYPSSVA